MAARDVARETLGCLGWTYWHLAARDLIRKLFCVIGSQDCIEEHEKIIVLEHPEPEEVVAEHTPEGIVMARERDDDVRFEVHQTVLDQDAFMGRTPRARCSGDDFAPDTAKTQ